MMNPMWLGINVKINGKDLVSSYANTTIKTKKNLFENNFSFSEITPVFIDFFATLTIFSCLLTRQL